MDTRTRKPRSSFAWQNLSASTFDNGERWNVVWDTQRKPDAKERNTAAEKSESGALERARHLLRMGFIVYEIRQPSGAVFLAEKELHERLGLVVTEAAE